MTFRTGLIVVLLIFTTGCTSFWGPSNKWRIEISESAKSDGNLVFRFTSAEADPIDVNVRVFDNTGENHIAHRIKNAFLEQLPRKNYKVEVDDGEDVLVKNTAGSPRFRIYLIENTVKSVRVNLDRE